MKYRFNSNADIPEWVLAEVSTLSKISCVRLKLITRLVIAAACGGHLDVDKVVKLTPAGITWSDTRAMLAAISFILTGAVRNAVDEGAWAATAPPRGPRTAAHTRSTPLPSTPLPLLTPPTPVKLNEELQQLGLPKENSDGISRPYRIHRERLRLQAAADSLRCPRLLSLDWRVDALVSTSALGQVRKLQAGSGSGGAAAEGALGEAITSLRRGLSHAEGPLPLRTPASDAAATPLLLGPALAAARAGAGAGAASPRMGSPLDLAEGRVAMSVLGIRPLEHAAGGLLGGSSSSSGSSGSSSSSGSSGAGAALHAEGSGTAILSPALYLDCTLSADAAAALLAELRVANAILQRTAASLPSQG